METNDRELGVGDYVGDIGMGVVRGGVGFGQSIYDLADTLTLDVLPDIDLKSITGVGTSKTWAGSLTEGITQFAIGFGAGGAAIKGASMLGKAGKLNKFGKVVAKMDDADKVRLNWKGDTVAGMASDFISFGGQEARLSNLIEEYPELRNPITEYLQADEDDGEFEGRMKNVLEGVGTDLLIAVPLARALKSGLDAMKLGRREIPIDGSDEAKAAIVDEYNGLASLSKEEYNNQAIQVNEQYSKMSLNQVTDIVNGSTTDEFPDKLQPFTPLAQHSDKVKQKARGFDKILNRLIIESKGRDKLTTQDDIAIGREFVKTFGSDPFDDVALSIIKDMGAQGTFEFTDSLLTMQKQALSDEGFGHTMAHELWHAASRSMDEKGVKRLGKYFDKRKAKWLKTDEGRGFEEAVSTLEPYGGRISKQEYRKLTENNEGSNHLLEHNQHITKNEDGSFSMKWTKDNYRYKDADEWFAESMADRTFDRLFSDIDPEASWVKQKIEALRSIMKSMADNFKAKLGFDPTEDFLNKFEKREYGERMDFLTLENRYRDGGGIKPPKMELRNEVPSQNAGDQLPQVNKFEGESTPVGIDQRALDEEASKAAQGETVGVGRKTRAIVDPNSSEAINRVTDTIASKLSKEGEAAKRVSNADVIEGTAKNMEELGLTSEADDIRAYGERLNEQAGKDSKAVNDAMYTVQALNEQMVEASKQMMDISEKMFDVTNLSTEASAKLAHDFNSQIKIYATHMARRTELASKSGGLLQFTSVGLNKPKKVKSEAKTLESMQHFNQMATSLSDEEIELFAKMIKANKELVLINPEIVGEFMNAASHKITLGDKVHKYWMSSILSGHKTASVNVVGGAGMSAIRIAAASASSALLGNTEVAGDLLKFSFQMDALMRAGSMFVSGLKEGGYSRFEGNTKVASSITDGVNRNPFQNPIQDLVGGLFNKVVDIPFRVLGSADAAMKSVNYNVVTQVKIADMLRREGITDPKVFAKELKSRMAKVQMQDGSMANPHNIKRITLQKMKESGEINNLQPSEVATKLQIAVDKATPDLEEYADVINHGKAWSDVSTYTNSLDRNANDAIESNAAKIVAGIQELPASRWIIPFKQTPMNVLITPIQWMVSPISLPIQMRAYAKQVKAYPKEIRELLYNGDTTAVLTEAQETMMKSFEKFEGERSKLLAGVQSKDPLVQAEAVSKVTLGMASWFGLMSVLNTSNERITGGGPTNIDERKRLMEAGWQPYSVKIGDKYYSYKKSDPISSVIGMGADIRDVYNDPENLDQGLAEKMFSAGFTATTRNILDKSFMSGLDTFMGAVDSPKGAERWLKNMGGSFIPSILSQGYESTMGEGQPLAKEAWTLMDSIKRRSVFMAGSLDDRRNILGEVVDVGELSNVLDVGFDSIVNITEEKDDTVLQEIANLRGGFALPSKEIAPNVSLLNYNGDNGKTAYNFYRKAHSEVKINGKTLRQAMDRTIKSNWYQKLNPQSFNGVKSPRIAELQKIMRKYRDEALQETLKEFPELESDYNSSMSIKRQAKTGMNMRSQIEEFINAQQ